MEPGSYTGTPVVVQYCVRCWAKAQSTANQTQLYCRLIAAVAPSKSTSQVPEQMPEQMPELELLVLVLVVWCW